MKCPSLCKDRSPWSRLFRRPRRFHSWSVLTRWLMTLLSRFHRYRSWRRQLKANRCRLVDNSFRAQVRYRSWGLDVWKAEKDKERANRVDQQARRAATLTGEPAAQSEKKTQPPGLDWLAGHIEAPNMEAGGSHTQATMMPDPWTTYKCPSASDNQAETIVSSETNRIPADRGVLTQTRVFRGARLRSATRAPSTRSRGPNLTKEELQQRNVQSRKSVFVRRRSMGTLPKATDSHSENKRKFRDEVQGKGTGRHPQQ